MSHFYADIQGNRGEATRGGSKDSGIDGHIRGWHTGARVVCHHDDESGKDIVRVYRTGGSSGKRGQELVAEWSTDFYYPRKKVCENVLALIETEECETCMNRFKCFTEREKCA